jgi:hypothetical protein
VAKKDDGPNVKTYPGGLGDEFPNGPPTTVIEHRGFRFVLRFEDGDLAGEGPVQEIRLLPDTQPLEPGVLRLIPSSSLYFGLARRHMELFGHPEWTEERWRAFREAFEAFRSVAGPGRALPDGFYRLLGKQYELMVDGGEEHPVKGIADLHTVKISTASKWLKEARRRGYLPPSSGGQDRSSASE